MGYLQGYVYIVNAAEDFNIPVPEPTGRYRRRPGGSQHAATECDRSSDHDPWRTPMPGMRASAVAFDLDKHEEATP